MKENLYRKYRPKTFDEIVGQKFVVEVLKNSLDSGNISHAYLFAGPRGTGKTSTARIFAKGLNCFSSDKPTSKVCGKCEACLEISEGRAVDVVEMDAASNRGIDEIRGLKEEVSFLPAKFRYKVYIIDEAHMLTREAFNALLKTLEEPPPHVVFVLATTEPGKMLPTVLSRCLRLDFLPLTYEEIASLIKRVCEKEGFTLEEEEAARFIFYYSKGGARDALTLLETVAIMNDGVISVEGVKRALNVAGYEEVAKTVLSYLEGDLAGFLARVRRMKGKGVGFQDFLKECVELISEVLVDRETGTRNPLVEESVEEALKENPGGLLEFSDLVQDVRERYKWETSDFLWEVLSVEVSERLGRYRPHPRTVSASELRTGRSVSAISERQGRVAEAKVNRESNESEKERQEEEIKSEEDSEDVRRCREFEEELLKLDLAVGVVAAGVDKDVTGEVLRFKPEKKLEAVALEKKKDVVLKVAEKYGFSRVEVEFGGEVKNIILEAVRSEFPKAEERSEEGARLFETNGK